MKVVWIDDKYNTGKEPFSKTSLKMFVFDNEETVNKFPSNGEFVLIIAAFDSLTPTVKVGYKRYVNCRVIEKKGKGVQLSLTEDKFYNLSQHAELRSEKISSLNIQE